MEPADAYLIRDVAALDALYGQPAEVSVVKEVNYLHPHYQAFIAASPFAVLATAGPGGLDASPRGDPSGFVEIADDRTLLLPDRRGNNRADSLRNSIADPRVALLFLIPGITETLRVNGTAVISTDPALLARYPMNGALPRSVVVVRVESVFFQCARALIRSDLWNPSHHLQRSALPSTGAILAALSECRLGGDQYDREQPERQRATLY